jgi:hypothetical protein
MFQIHALQAAQFTPLFGLSDDELAAQRACRITVDATPGYPCRVSLADAEIGERVILLNYLHQPSDNPYRAAHAIYVREKAQQACPRINEVPKMIGCRPVSLRAFDADDWLVTAELATGHAISKAIESIFDNEEVAYIHLHTAKLGCYLASATRA